MQITPSSRRLTNRLGAHTARPTPGFFGERGAVSVSALIVGVILIVIVVAVVVWLGTRDETPPVSAPAIPQTTPMERGDEARERIADLEDQREESATEEPDYDGVFAEAMALRDQGKSADAQLMLFYAARASHVPSALALAESYDPRHDRTSSDVTGPDAFQAYKWYSVAVAAGDDSAREQLAGLRTWAEDEAGQGNGEAERLLLQWGAGR